MAVRSAVGPQQDGDSGATERVARRLSDSREETFGAPETGVQLLALQRAAGNRAVARLVADGRAGRRTIALQRQGWGGASEGRWHEQVRSGGWNEQTRIVGATLRIPVQGIAGVGLGVDRQSSTNEAAGDGPANARLGRAVVIVPPNVNLGASLDVLLHFHGLNVGYRERSTASQSGMAAGTVRDVEADLIPQQLEHSGRNIVGVLAQGAADVPYGRRFGISDPRAYVQEALRLAVPDIRAQRPGAQVPDAPRPTRIIASGHSGGGPETVAAAGALAPGAAATEDEWVNGTPLLLFDAINNPTELDAAVAVMRQMLAVDLLRLTAAGADAPALLSRRGLKLRSLYGTGSWDGYRAVNIGGTAHHSTDGSVAFVVAAANSLKGKRDAWFADAAHASALGSNAATLRDQYRIEQMTGVHEWNVGTGGQATAGRGGRAGGITSPSPGVPNYTGGGHLEESLTSLPANATPAPTPTGGGAKTSSLQELTDAPTVELATKRRLDRQGPDPDIPPPTDAERQHAADLLIDAAEMKAREHRINTAQVCLVEPAEFTPGSIEITYLPPPWVRRTLEGRAGDAALTAAFDQAVGRILGQGRRTDFVMVPRAYDEVPALLRLLEIAFISDPDASTLDLLSPELTRRYRVDTHWAHEDYPGGIAGPNEGRAVQMASDLGRIRPERRANIGSDAVLRGDDMGLPRIREFVAHELVPVPGLTGYRLNRGAAAAFDAMRTAAAAEGIALEPAGTAGSGVFYRTPEQSAASAASSGNVSAVAAFSSHNLGLAVDLQMSFAGHQFSETTTRPMTNVIGMRQSPAHKWLFVRGARWGFYPYQNEPWHWEYNPPGFRSVFMTDYRTWRTSAQAPARHAATEVPAGDDALA